MPASKKAEYSELALDHLHSLDVWDPRSLVVAPNDSTEPTLLGCSPRARPQSTSWRLAILGTALVLAVSMAAAVQVWRSSTFSGASQVSEPSTVSVALEVPHTGTETMAMMFKQCGGEEWSGSTCCEPGCACMMHTKFYSQCVPPRGMAECSAKAAVNEVKRAKIKAATWKPLAQKRARAAEEAEKKRVAAMDALADAKKAKEKADQAARKLIEKDEIAQRDEAHADALTIKAASAAEEKIAANTTAAAKLAELQRLASLRSLGKCSGMFGQCGGASFDQTKSCCQKGCDCIFKDNFYSQCEAPKEDGFCNAEKAESKEKVIYSTAGQLKVEAAQAEQVLQARKLDAADAKANAIAAAKAAAPFRFALAQSEITLVAKTKAAQAAADEAAETKAAAKRADLQATIWSVAVMAWGRAKTSDPCGTANASDNTTKETRESNITTSDEDEGEADADTDANDDAGVDGKKLPVPTASDGLTELRFLMKRMMSLDSPTQPPSS